MRTLLLCLLAPFIAVGFPIFLAVLLIMLGVVGLLKALEMYMRLLDTLQMYLIWRRNES